MTVGLSMVLGYRSLIQTGSFRVMICMSRPANDDDVNTITKFRKIHIFFSVFLIIDHHGAIGLLSNHVNIHRWRIKRYVYQPRWGAHASFDAFLRSMNCATLLVSMVMRVSFQNPQSFCLATGHKDGSNTWALDIPAFWIWNYWWVVQQLLSLLNTQDQPDMVDDAQIIDELL